jgi:hypothetical protein
MIGNFNILNIFGLPWFLPRDHVNNKMAITTHYEEGAIWNQSLCNMNTLGAEWKSLDRARLPRD